MAQAIRVNVIGQAYDDVVLNMSVRENRDKYRMIHDIIINSVCRAIGDNDGVNAAHLSQAIYDTRMKGKVHVVCEGNDGIEYQIHMVSGDESILCTM